MLDLLLKIALIYSAFGLINLIVLLAFFNMKHTLYFTKVGKTKIDNEEYFLYQKDPLWHQLYTSIIVILVWPYLVTVLAISK